jgi:hypothetical protein
MAKRRAAETPPWYVDPSDNVKALVELTTSHQEELRKLESAHVREMMSAETRRMDELAALRAEHARLMRQAEADRIDAIRLVDVEQVRRAAEVQAQQQQTLATQVVTTADAFRASLTAALQPLQTRIDELSKAQYETQGQKQQVVETRDVRADSRLNWNVIIAALVLAVALYAALRK